MAPLTPLSERASVLALPASEVVRGARDPRAGRASEGSGGWRARLTIRAGPRTLRSLRPMNRGVTSAAATALSATFGYPQPPNTGVTDLMSRHLLAARRKAPWRPRAALVAVFLLLSAALPLRAQNAPVPGAPEEDPNEPVLPFVTSDDGILLTTLVKVASQQTNRTFLYAPEFKPNPTQKIITTNVLPVPRKELFNVYKAVLKAHNFALVPIGPADAKMFLVATLQSNTAKQLIPTAPFVDADELGAWKDTTELIRTVIPLKYTDISKAKTELAGLVNPSYGAINTIQSVNALIITEFAPTVYAIQQMLSVMDQKQAEAQLQFKKIPLRHAVAEELEPILAELLATDGGGQANLGLQARARATATGESILSTPEPKIITEPRTNSLIVYAVREDMEKIESLVAQLDQEIEGEEGKVHIYQLQHAIAEDVEETLSELLQGSLGGGVTRGRRSGQRGFETGAPGGSPVIGSTLQEQDIIIVAEKHTNSLLIQASKTQYSTLKTIIDAIDVRLPQVLIEAAVVELTENFGDVFGIDLGYAGSVKGDQVVFGTQNGVAPIVFDPDTGTATRDVVTGGVAGTLIGGVFTDGDFSIPILLQAAKTRDNTNLLSLPSVITNNNQEATLTIGTQQPTGTIGAVGSGGSTTQTIGFGGYVDANLTLSISPYISAGDYLRLEINLLVESFGSDPNPSDSIPPPKSTRELSTSITVPDNATIVLGGLKQSDDRESETKVPLLGDIPILGALFRRTSKSKAETTLYLFVSPHIIKEQSFGDIRDLTRQKIREMEALIGDKVYLVDPTLKPRSAEEAAAGTEPKSAEEKAILLPGVPRYVSPGDSVQPETFGADRSPGGARPTPPAGGPEGK